MSFYYSYTILDQKIYISEVNKIIVSIDLKPAASIYKETLTIKQAYKEINEYLQKKRHKFSFPYHYEGSKFQEEVWKTIESIPYGQTLSYKEIAKIINRPKAYQAIGTACKNNPLLFIVPCHRVVSQNKNNNYYKLGSNNKIKLLNLESY